MPPLETKAKKWPTLGDQVCDWIEENLVHGPGDLRGRPVTLSEEQRFLVYRMYEVFPQGHPRAGRRRFKRVCISLAKGLAKTELAAFIAAAELSPTAPVRCGGFGRRGRPVGVAVVDPYIPMIAYTEEQSEDLAYGALRVILEASKVANDFDIGLERIMRVKGDGEAAPVATAPDARDGARTSFQHADETHRFKRRSRANVAHKTMLANIPKRRGADAWTLETTTAPAPGEGSVAEAAHNYARAVREGRASDPTFFFFHREAGQQIVKRADGSIDAAALREAVVEASGPAASWRDVESITAQWLAPEADHPYLERVWLNRLVRAGDKAFDLEAWRKLEMKGATIPRGALVTLGFDGSRADDATALVATDVETGLQQLLGLWERPEGPLGDEWRVPEADVDAAVHSAFETYEVWRLYADPPFWESTVAKWEGEFGSQRVVPWVTYKYVKMAPAVRAYVNAMTDGSVRHTGDADLARHIGNSHRRPVSVRDEHGKAMFVLQKEREGSPLKIDAAMAGCLSWQACLDARALGAKRAEKKASVYERRGLRTLEMEPSPA